MNKPVKNSATPGLVEPQGVNAASLADEDSAPGQDVRSGGHPERAEQMDALPEREEHVGPPDQSAGGPGQELGVGEG